MQEEKAQSIIRTVTNKRLVGNLQSLKAQGQLTLDKVRSLPLLHAFTHSPACGVAVM